MSLVRIGFRYVSAVMVMLFAGGAPIEGRAQSDGETAAWLAARRMDTRVAYEQFLLHFSNSRFVELAMDRLVALTLNELNEDAEGDPGIRGFGTTVAPRPDVY